MQKIHRSETKHSTIKRRQNFQSTAERNAFKDLNLMSATLFLDEPSNDKLSAHKNFLRLNSHAASKNFVKKVTQLLNQQHTMQGNSDNIKVTDSNISSSFQTSDLSESEKENENGSELKFGAMSSNQQSKRMSMSIQVVNPDSIGPREENKDFAPIEYRKQLTKASEFNKHKRRASQIQTRKTIVGRNIDEIVDSDKKQKLKGFTVLSTADIKAHAQKAQKSSKSKFSHLKSLGLDNLDAASKVSLQKQAQQQRENNFKRAGTQHYGKRKSGMFQASLMRSNTSEERGLQPKKDHPDHEEKKFAKAVLPKIQVAEFAQNSVDFKKPIDKSSFMSGDEKFSHRQGEDSVRVLIQDVDQTEKFQSVSEVSMADFETQRLQGQTFRGPKEFESGWNPRRHDTISERDEASSSAKVVSKDGLTSKESQGTNLHNAMKSESMQGNSSEKQFVFQKQGTISESKKFTENNKRIVHAAWLFHPEDWAIVVFELLATIALVTACFMTPFSLAFPWLDENENGHIFDFDSTWTSIDSIIDMIYILELFVCFNTSYYELDINGYVISRKTIAWKYLRAWFWIDCVAIIPRFIRPLEREDNLEFLVRILAFMKVARIGRLFKLLRLLKLAKTLKKKKKIQEYMQTKMKLSVAKERLAVFAIFSILFVHTIACLWIHQADISRDSNTNWIDSFGYDYDNTSEIYIIGVYWTVTTITTVGYGDISATNSSERVVACLIMIIGVIAFSFSTGSLSSIISNVDSRQAAYRQRLDVLKDLRMQYKINDGLYMELNAFINFQSQQRDKERDSFINELPERLKYRVSELLYEEYRKKIYFFNTMQGNANFIAWLCPNLKPLEVIQGALIQVEQEKLTSISFIKEGQAEYVLQRYINQPYLICSQGDHFGVLDIVFRQREIDKQVSKNKNERRMLRMQQQNNRDQYDESASSIDSDDEEMDEILRQKILCKFTVRARKTCYLLQMEKSALEKMNIEFPEVWRQIVQQELPICLLALQRKAEMIYQLNRDQKLQKKIDRGLQQNNDQSEKDGKLSQSSQPQSSSDNSSGEQSEVTESEFSSSSDQSNSSQNNNPVELQNENCDRLDVSLTSKKTEQQRRPSCVSLTSQSSDKKKLQSLQRHLTRRQNRNVPATLNDLRQQRDVIHEENESSNVASSQDKKSSQSSNQKKDFGKISQKDFEDTLEKQFSQMGEDKKISLTHQRNTDTLTSPNTLQAFPNKSRQRSKSMNSKQALISNPQMLQVAKLDVNSLTNSDSTNSLVSSYHESPRLSNKSLKLVPQRSKSSPTYAQENATKQVKSNGMFMSIEKHQKGKMLATDSPKSNKQAQSGLVENFDKTVVSKKQQRLEKNLDDDERMVMEGFADAVNNQQNLEKTAKSLTKKFSNPRQSFRSPNKIQRGLQRNKSMKMRSISNQLPGIYPQGLLGVAQESQIAAGHDEIDNFLFSNQKGGGLNESRKSQADLSLEQNSLLTSGAVSKEFSLPHVTTSSPSKKDTNLKQVSYQFKMISDFQQKIMQQVNSLKKEMAEVKTDQTKMSNQMRQSHEQLMKVANSEISAQRSESDSKNERSSEKNSRLNRGVGINIQLNNSRTQSQASEIKDDKLIIPRNLRWSHDAGDHAFLGDNQNLNVQQAMTGQSADRLIKDQDKFYNSVKDESS